MCHYIDQPFYYSKFRAQPRHIQPDRKWDECQKAKETGTIAQMLLRLKT